MIKKSTPRIKRNVLLFHILQSCTMLMLKYRYQANEQKKRLKYLKPILLPLSKVIVSKLTKKSIPVSKGAKNDETFLQNKSHRKVPVLNTVVKNMQAKIISCTNQHELMVIAKVRYNLRYFVEDKLTNNVYVKESSNFIPFFTWNHFAPGSRVRTRLRRAVVIP